MGVIFILLIIFTAYTFYSFRDISEIKIEETTTTIKPLPKYKPYYYSNETRMVAINVPAVDSQGNGVMSTLSVEVRPGNGKTLVDINQILLWVDTQDSIRTAKIVSENITGMDLSEYDIVYSVITNASIIEGPSAGAAMAIATIAAIEDREINGSVSISAVLTNGGKIDKVSSVVEKAKAVKNADMKLFLVPSGQGYGKTYVEEKKCESYLFTTFCHTKTVTKETNLEDEVGIRVEEVSNIQEALKYFLI